VTSGCSDRARRRSRCQRRGLPGRRGRRSGTRPRRRP
jgi:hypothetical protein